jgi:hypothetical protein
MSDQSQHAWEIALSQHGDLYLYSIADKSDCYTVQRPNSDRSPLLTLRTLVRLAVEVIRNRETARQYSYMAIRQLRLRSSQTQKRSLKARVERIREYYGGSLSDGERNVLSNTGRINLDAETYVEHIEGDVWRILSISKDEAPLLSWNALVTLSVQVLRDPLLESLFPNLYVPYLRTPNEALELNEAKNELRHEKEEEQTSQYATCSQDFNQRERKELEAFLEELVTKEEQLKENETRLQENLNALRIREQNLHRLEEHLFSLRAKIQQELPPQEKQERRRKRKRSRNRR